MNIWLFVLIILNLHILAHCKDDDSDRKACFNNTQQWPLNRVNTTDKLAALREVMNSSSAATPKGQIQVLYITTGDEHQSEFVSDYDKRLRYISGFSGSNGEALITMDAAILWTDGRYHLQADDELDCNWIVMKTGNEDALTKAEWLKFNFPNGAIIGTDSKLIAANVWQRFELELQINKNFSLMETNVNLIDAIWSGHNETSYMKPGFTVGITYTGKNWTTKVNETREKLKMLRAEAMVITALDEIAWLLNIRGFDIPMSYFLKSYVLLSQNEIILYADPTKIAGNISTFFETYPITPNYTIKFEEYNNIWTDLPQYAQSWKHVLVPSLRAYSGGASKKIYDCIPEEKRISEPSPIIDLKAIKNPVEILGMERAHIRDAAALIKFLSYFESHFHTEIWDEVRAVKELNRFRLEQDLCLNISFDTIVGFGPHGAQPHYQPTVISSVRIFDNSTLVIDSGGQYYDGTTDVTRTIHMGTPTKQQREMYTRVLMGTIQLSSLVFPESLNANSVDVLARSPLWETGYDYMHGTGHGIGAFLNVHESPISIAYKSGDRLRFKPGHFLSNEPGYYREGDFGIRLENIIKVVIKLNSTDQQGICFLGFEDITLVPYDMKLIDCCLLNNNHIKWLNNYNNRIRNIVGAELERQGAKDAYNWMIRNTRHISCDCTCNEKQRNVMSKTTSLTVDEPDKR